MTADEKTKTAFFLDTALDYLGTGYRPERTAYLFEDDRQPEAKSPTLQDNVTSLPLAYLINEEEEDDDNGQAENHLVMIIWENSAKNEKESAQLLDRVLASAGLYKNKNCIAVDINAGNNVTDNDNDNDNFIEHFIEQKINTIKPKIILCLGKTTPHQISDCGIPVFSTYHPDELTRDESLKRPAFEDMKNLMASLVTLDSKYAWDVHDLLKKYAATDAEFAAKVREFLA